MSPPLTKLSTSSDFIVESLRIKGINRPPTIEEKIQHDRFIEQPASRLAHLEFLQNFYYQSLREAAGKHLI